MFGQWYQGQWQAGYILIHVYFQLPVSKQFGSQIIMHSSTQKNDVSLAKQFQEHLSKENQVGWHNMYTTTRSVPDCDNIEEYYFIVVYSQGLSIWFTDYHAFFHTESWCQSG